MSQLILTEVAMQDYGNLVGYLAEVGATEQATTVANLLDEAFERVCQLPNSSRMFDSSTNIRECLVRYGNAGYSFLYHYDQINDTIIILTIKHYRQGNYSYFKNSFV